MRREGRAASLGNIPAGELRLERLLSDFSFIRINIDYIGLQRENENLQRLQQRGALFGYTLQYSFPCTDGVSSSLRHRVRLRAHSFTSNAIYFRHKRVVLVKLNRDVIPFWSRTSLHLDLEAQLNVQGKFSTRPLGRCSIPLEELLLPPFAISRDFDFIGQNFEGSAFVKIDLGSQQRALMERLERWRHEGSEVMHDLNEIFNLPPARHTRSRSGERCRSRCSSDVPEPEDDDVFIDEPRRGPSPTPFRPTQPSVVYARPTVSTRTSVPSTSSLRDQAAPKMQSIKVSLVVHAAHGLPMVRDARGLLIPPSACISVRGRDGELRSPVRLPSRSPRFDWACTFHVSGERRSIIVKLLHHTPEGEDTPLGFVPINLPMASVSQEEFELARLNDSAGEHATVTMSVDASPSRPPSKLDAFIPVNRPVDNVERQRIPSGMSGSSSTLPLFSRNTRSEDNFDMHRNRGGYSNPASDYRIPVRRRSPSPPEVLILESKEEIENRLRRNMNELDVLIRRIDSR